MNSCEILLNELKLLRRIGVYSEVIDEGEDPWSETFYEREEKGEFVYYSDIENLIKKYEEE